MVTHYRIHERPLGFTVEARDRVPVSVEIIGTGFRVHAGRGPRQLRLFNDFVPESPDSGRGEGDSFCNLIQYRRLVALVSAGLMSEWKPQREYLSARITNWAVSKTRQSLGKRIHAQWQQLLCRAAPNVVRVQRAVFAATLSDCPLLHERELYDLPYFAADVQRFRAAASLPPIAQALVSGVEEPYFADGLDFAPGTVIAEMDDWQRLYSPTRTSYRSLQRTLSNLPGGIPSRLLFQLSRLKLERPVTDRLELLALLSCRQETRDDLSALSAPRMRLFMHATRDEIKAAMVTVAQFLREPLSHRRAEDVGRFVQLVMDYPGNHRGRLSGLVAKSIRWHRAEEQAETARSVEKLGLDTKTASPPIPLPESSEIQFLTTVAQVVNTADIMDNCMASYADRAVKGDSYLFHCEHRGESAAVEVDWSGRVRQAQGPRNSINRAAMFGRKLLEKWGAAFPHRTSHAETGRGLQRFG